MVSGIESDFFEFSLIPRGKYRIVMTRSLLERKFFDVISLKVEKPTTENFAYLPVSLVPLLVENFKSIC